MSILLLGDILVDKYFIGASDALCPELPVPVVKVNKVESTLGGIGNVVRSMIGFFEKVHFLSSFCLEDEEILTKCFRDVVKDHVEKNNECITVENKSLSLSGICENEGSFTVKIDGLNSENSTKRKVLRYNNFIQENRRMAVLNRIMVGTHCVSRYDYPADIISMSRENEDLMLSYIQDHLLPDLSIVILSDYNRGALTERFCQRLVSMLKKAGVIILVDPIKRDWDKFQGATLMKPNREEAGYVFGSPITNEESGRLFAQSALHKYGIKFILNTLDSEGMALYHLKDQRGGNLNGGSVHEKNPMRTFSNGCKDHTPVPVDKDSDYIENRVPDSENGESSHPDVTENLASDSKEGKSSTENRVPDSENGKSSHPDVTEYLASDFGGLYQIRKPCHPNCKPIDVLGCGDSIIAAVAVFIQETKGWTNQLHQMMTILSLVGKKAVETEGCYVLNPTEWSRLLKQCVMEEAPTKKTVVFSNGCFDLLHVEHVRLLKYCKNLGGHFILAVNSDESVRLNKGPNRPINTSVHRIRMLKELDLADEIIEFDEKTPIELIRSIRPDFLVKGRDYSVDQVVGREYAKQVVLFKGEYNISSSKMIQGVIESYGKNHATG